MIETVKNNISDIGNKEVHSIYYLITFLSDFAVSTISAVYVLFLLSKGLNLLEVNLVNLAFMIGNFIFEIPTGAYADYFGRKKSVILSNIFLAIGFGVYFLANSFVVFIIAEIIVALAFTFESGALDAWLVDALEQKSYIGKVDYVFSHANIISQIAGLLGGLVGAYIGTRSLQLPMGVAALVSLVTVFVTIFMMHENFVPKTILKLSDGIRQVSSTAKEGLLYGIRHHVIFWFTIAVLLLNFAFQPLNMYWSPRMYSLAGHQVIILGWAWVGISLFMIFGGIIVRKLLDHHPDYFTMFVYTMLILGLPIFLAALSQTFYIVLTAFLTYEIGRGMFSPLQKSYLNKHIQSATRATVLSFNSMMGKLGAALGLVIMGIIAQQHSIQLSWIIAAIMMLAMIGIFVKVAKSEQTLTLEKQPLLDIAA
jgi:MFS family permease